jgi:hypothetical protein
VDKPFRTEILAAKGERMVRTTIAIVATVVVLSCAPAALGYEDVIQRDSADEVAPGTVVTYTMTVTNTTGVPEHLGLGTLLTRYHSDASVDDPYLSIQPSQGSCAIAPLDSYGYASAECDLGTIAPGATVTVVDSVKANFSLDHLASTGDCDMFGCGSGGPISAESTFVVHPPEVTGSPKLEFSGVPTPCADRDFVVKVKARGHGVRRMTASLSGPRDEFGHIAGDLDFNPPKSHGAKLKVKLDAEHFDPGYYRLTALALRGPKPKLKGSTTFLVCGAENLRSETADEVVFERG